MRNTLPDCLGNPVKIVPRNTETLPCEKYNPSDGGKRMFGHQENYLITYFQEAKKAEDAPDSSQK